MRAIRTLATETVSTALSSPSRQFLTFFSGGECYAFDITHVKEILSLSHITPIPLMPDFIRGVMNLHGIVVPVIDLSARLGQGISSQTKRSCTVIIDMHHADNHFYLSVIVDSVSQVIELQGDQIQTPPHFGSKIRSEFIDAILKIQDRFIIALKLDQVFSIDELSQLAALNQTSLD